MTSDVLIKANLEIDDVKKIVLDLYGLEIKYLAELNGYDDKNYHIRVDDRSIDGYVLKIINSLDSKNGALFDAQTSLLIHLGKKGFPCPRPICMKNGEYFTKIKLENVEHVIRLLEYIDGTVIHKVPYTSQLLYQVGEFVSLTDEAMKGFHHVAFAQTESIWKMDSVPKLEDYVFAVDDEERRRLCRTVVGLFRTRVLSKRHSLDKGLIHGDLNEQNILVENVDEVYRIKAIIDFGDCHHGCYLFELAITMAYMILSAKDIAAGAHILAGYRTHRELPEEEYSLLKICVAARLCQSLVLGAYFSKQDPGNSYILMSAAHGWEMLEKLWEIPDDELLKKWRNLVDIYKP